MLYTDINIVEQIKLYDQDKKNGGNLHHVLYDLEPTDHYLEDAITLCLKQGDASGYDLAYRLLGMTYEDRLDAIIQADASWVRELDIVDGREDEIDRVNWIPL